MAMEREVNGRYWQKGQPDERSRLSADSGVLSGLPFGVLRSESGGIGGESLPGYSPCPVCMGGVGGRACGAATLGASSR